MKFEIGNQVQTVIGIGEVLFIDHSRHFPYLVGIKGYNECSGEAELTEGEIQKIVIDKGYEGQCWWFRENELELIKENKMNEYVELLMEELDLEIGDEFDIIDLPYGPYHFDEKGNLIDKKGDKINSIIFLIMIGKWKINKIKSIKLTEKEIKKLELYLKNGFTTIAEILKVNKQEVK